MDLPPDAVVVAEVDGQPIQWRTATSHYWIIQDGALTSRPLTAEELRAMVEEAAAVVVETTRRTIEQKADAALGELQALLDTTNATINSSPAPYIKGLARVLRLAIRLLLRRFDGAA